MTKEEFNENFRRRTKKIAVDVINLLSTLPPHKVMRVIAINSQSQRLQLRQIIARHVGHAHKQNSMLK